MCGIVGYVGVRPAVDVLLNCLSRLEYRGYDSAGVAVLDGENLFSRRATGKLESLRRALERDRPAGTVGIGHTRWATHGVPCERNAHPLLDCRGELAVVHNGIIENYRQLRSRLERQGHYFASETDTEVIAHLVESHYRGDLVEATRRALRQLEGSFAIAVVSRHEPARLVAARRHSPLVIGQGEGETFLASDIPALLPYTKQVLLVEDGEVAAITASGARLTRLEGQPVERASFQVPWDSEMAEKGGFPHFMLKEIMEQPAALAESMRGRLDQRRGRISLKNELGWSRAELRRINQVVVLACGTACHAGMVADHALEALARLPVKVEVASELRHRDVVADPHTLALAISQSGETADTLAALGEVQRHGARVVAITNTVGSSLARAAQAVLYTQAGPEIAVASTKAYTTQLAVIYLLAAHLGQARGVLDEEQTARLADELALLPERTEQVLAREDRIRQAAQAYCQRPSFYYLGRGINRASALEGALKLKEISYLHAEGYPAGEMKHGPIALIGPELPTVGIAVPGPTYRKMLGNLEEVRSRQGPVVGVGWQGDRQIAGYCDHYLAIPRLPELFSPVPIAAALQLFAYCCAELLGREIDQPRNLAKSVTVE